MFQTTLPSYVLYFRKYCVPLGGPTTTLLPPLLPRNRVRATFVGYRRTASLWNVKWSWCTLSVDAHSCDIVGWKARLQIEPQLFAQIYFPWMRSIIRWDVYVIPWYASTVCICQYALHMTGRFPSNTAPPRRWLSGGRSPQNRTSVPLADP